MHGVDWDESSASLEDAPADHSTPYIDHSLSFVEPFATADNAPPGNNITEQYELPSFRDSHVETDTSQLRHTLDGLPKTQQLRVGWLSLIFHLIVCCEILFAVAILVLLCALWEHQWADDWFTSVSFSNHISSAIVGTYVVIAVVVLSAYPSLLRVR